MSDTSKSKRRVWAAEEDLRGSHRDLRVKAAPARRGDWKAEGGCCDAESWSPCLTSLLHLLPSSFSVLKDF